MLFSSYNFLFVFLPAILIIYYISDKKYRNYILLIFSFMFYAYNGFKFLLVLSTSILINYTFGLIIERLKEKTVSKKIILYIAVMVNIVLLLYFKNYFNFFIGVFNGFFKMNFTVTQIIMPLGVSFYTFQGISYLADIYKGQAKAQKNILNVTLYISMFPEIISGPIVKYQTFESQINDRNINIDKFALGIEKFIVGLAKKLIIADTFAKVANEIFAMKITDLNIGLAWIGILAYTIQIYFDFSGYSDMAIGIAKMLGFEFPENFNYPYISKSITEFWRRWHISLSTWFRDYVYIPLGGNKVSYGRRVFNIFVVWFLTGFWHGASWNFIIWGIYYAVILILEKYVYGKFLKRAPSFISHLYALFIVIIGWVFFKSNNLAYAGNYIKTMFNLANTELAFTSFMRYVIEYKFEWIIAIIASTPIYLKIKRSNFMKGLKGEVIVVVYLLIIFSVSITYLIASTYKSFIYFQF